ncbi:hypothetical protein FF011L_13990 [Roseimaritima multifibrata]|uniref:Uncharacterized protein n=2 Tax=Roseimaritima multifibrata TaxID=1930274 RepID=A0A517MCN7_9BACT|nr:hypothetical protein FF011L_13990 [Roseimaritima multifibrata]
MANGNGASPMATRMGGRRFFFSTSVIMGFIELTGKTLLDIVNEGEIDLGELHAAGVRGDSILRVNQYGEIELRAKADWRLVGGLIGNFENRLRTMTGLEWAV